MPDTSGSTSAAAPVKGRGRFVGLKSANKQITASKQSDASSNAAVAEGPTPDSITDVVPATKPKRVVKSGTKRMVNRIPADIMENEALAKAMEALPKNYNFEIYKSVWRLRATNSKRVALQFPEGLLMFSLVIADILEEFAGVECVVMGDVTYGACCVDDFSARSLGCDFMIHYGHSCLVPIDTTLIRMLYVFVDIQIDIKHFVDSVKHNFRPGANIALVCTIQFSTALQGAREALSTDYTVIIPQTKPLSPGELLGCTAPRLQDNDYILYLGDGRFHLESIMIMNPNIPAYRYDPYSKVISIETYDTEQMHSIRRAAIREATKAKTFGLIMGTLGRQGSPQVVDGLKQRILASGMKCVEILLSEIMPGKLACFKDVDAFIQIACPRLSIDWGYAFDKPLLTPYEASVVFDTVGWQSIYPMDFYAADSLGDWTPNNPANKPLPVRKSAPSAANKHTTGVSLGAQQSTLSTTSTSACCKSKPDTNDLHARTGCCTDTQDIAQGCCSSGQ
ncbi:hypothetical protein SARC_03387 [Sphaeroforma arctica JP610]|uniref:2-(3-amino-3-carboxypropyl)histidine synthase subunit 1 n=1 Tax=Sphaeroforma arctica JP610 TaxID=667725 RepID=A0A0L0G617_9EUKA|nr:hypothetical protein SARC_03387 [Sphaeroforma arctica JP610]KNC84394.1 hypothetical protein SARC_03387 [Sphaeroforma arctica JP610]|eukprot:XP_014158296.1 hypothetical protein SARC_03387 [Sphaeroforma arctica JP610]